MDMEKENPESLLVLNSSVEPLEDIVLLVDVVCVVEDRVLHIAEGLGMMKGVGDRGREG